VQGVELHAAANIAAALEASHSEIIDAPLAAPVAATAAVFDQLDGVHPPLLASAAANATADWPGSVDLSSTVQSSAVDVAVVQSEVSFDDSAAATNVAAAAAAAVDRATAASIIAAMEAKQWKARAKLAEKAVMRVQSTAAKAAAKAAAAADTTAAVSAAASDAAASAAAAAAAATAAAALEAQQLTSRAELAEKAVMRVHTAAAADAVAAASAASAAAVAATIDKFAAASATATAAVAAAEAERWRVRAELAEKAVTHAEATAAAAAAAASQVAVYVQVSPPSPSMRKATREAAELHALNLEEEVQTLRGRLTASDAKLAAANDDFTAAAERADIRSAAAAAAAAAASAAAETRSHREKRRMEAGAVRLRREVIFSNVHSIVLAIADIAAEVAEVEAIRVRADEAVAELARARAELGLLSKTYRLNPLVLDADFIPPAVNPRLVSKMLGVPKEEEEEEHEEVVEEGEERGEERNTTSARTLWSDRHEEDGNAASNSGVFSKGRNQTTSSDPPARVRVRTSAPPSSASTGYTYVSGEKLRVIERAPGRITAAAAAAAVAAVPRLPLKEIARERMARDEAAARKADAAATVAAEKAAVVAAAAAADFEERFGLVPIKDDEALQRQAAVLAYAAKISANMRAKMASENVDAKIAALKEARHRQAAEARGARRRANLVGEGVLPYEKSLGGGEGLAGDLRAEVPYGQAVRAGGGGTSSSLPVANSDTTAMSDGLGPRRRNIGLHAARLALSTAPPLPHRIPDAVNPFEGRVVPGMSQSQAAWPRESQSCAAGPRINQSHAAEPHQSVSSASVFDSRTTRSGQDGFSLDGGPQMSISQPISGGVLGEAGRAASAFVGAAARRAAAAQAEAASAQHALAVGFKGSRLPSLVCVSHYKVAATCRVATSSHHHHCPITELPFPMIIKSRGGSLSPNSAVIYQRLTDPPTLFQTFARF
jgi:hypothetical protein